MRLLIWVIVAALLSVGTALASDDWDNWGTPYYDQVMKDSYSADRAVGTTGCTSCAQEAQGGCSHCGSGAPAPSMGSGCSHCGSQAPAPAGGCASCGKAKSPGCSGGICGTTDYQDADSAWAWMFD